MDSILFDDGTIVQSSDLNDLQQRKATSIKQRISDTRIAGVIAEKSPNQIVYTDGRTLGIFAVVAYNLAGERIYVAPNANPELPAIQGLLPDDTGLLISGGTALVPQQTYTLVITYAEYKAPPVKYHVVTGAQFLTELNSTYKLYLRSYQNVLENDVILATISVSDTGVIRVDESSRQLSVVPATAVIGSIDVVKEAGSYGESISFQEHLNSIGTGIPTNINPHGTTAADLGIDIGALADHQKLLHSDGIRSDNLASTTSAMYPYYRRESLTNEEVVYISPLSEALNEMAVINGTSLVPSQFSTVFSYSFLGKAGDVYAGYYLFSYDIIKQQIVVNGPFDTENHATLIQLLKTAYLFPVCSLKWAYVNYDVTGDGTPDVGSFNIIPATFKDYRVFNNTTIKNFRPNQIFALSQFAPVANDVAYLHNAQIIGAVAAPLYPVAGKTLNLRVDGDTDVSVSFAGANPMPAASVINQMITAFARKDANNNSYLAVYPRLTKNGFISLSAPISVSVTPAASAGAEEAFGFSSAKGNMTSDTKGLIREMIYYGERNGLILFFYNNIDDVTEIDYYLGGGKVLKNIFTYKKETITHVNELIEEL